MAWARSPSTVIDPEGARRAIMRNCIGVRSCASSTTMWPYVRVRPPIREAASSSRARSSVLHAVDATVAARDRSNQLPLVIGEEPGGETFELRA